MKLKITNSIQDKILAQDFVSFMFYMLLNKYEFPDNIQ